MSDLYIPPKEISFRLKNKKSEKVLFSRKKSPVFGQFSGETYADQWWYLVPGEGANQGWYLVKSRFTENVLFSRTARTPKVDHTDGNGKWADQWFKLEKGTGDRQNWFRLLNTTTNTVVVSGGDGVTNSKADGATDDNQYWAFEFEDMEFVSLDYHIDQHKVLSSTPAIVGQNTARNDTDTLQTITLALTKTTTTTSTFEYTLGINVEITAGINAGWAMLVEGKIEVSTAVKNEWKWGKQNADTDTTTTTLAVAARPWSGVTAVATATKSDIELPFTITWKSKKTGYKVQTKGVYKGSNYWNNETRFRQLDEGESESRELNPDDLSEGWEKVEPIERLETSAGDEERSLDDDQTLEGRNEVSEKDAPQNDGVVEVEDNIEGTDQQEEPARDTYRQEENDYEQRNQDEEEPARESYGQGENDYEQRNQDEEEGCDEAQGDGDGEEGDNAQSHDYEQDRQHSAELQEEEYENSGEYTENDERGSRKSVYDDQPAYYGQPAEESERVNQHDIGWGGEQEPNRYRADRDYQEDGGDAYEQI